MDLKEKLARAKRIAKIEIELDNYRKSLKSNNQFKDYCNFRIQELTSELQREGL